MTVPENTRPQRVGWSRSESPTTFSSLSYDDSIYIKRIEGQLPQVCAVYVDDVWIFTQQQSFHDAFLRTLREHFRTTEPVHLHDGETAVFLAHEVSIKDDILCFSQTGYIEQCKQKSVPKYLSQREMNIPVHSLNPQHFDPTWLASPDDAVETDFLTTADMTTLRGIVNTISYCSGSTHPELAAPLSVLARSQGGGRVHKRVLASAKNLLRYMFHNVNFETRIPISNFRVVPGSVKHYCLHVDFDASFGQERSREGVILFLNNSYCQHKSSLQTTVSLSTTEAELGAASSAARLIMGSFNFLNELLKGVGFANVTAPVMWGDNSAANQIGNCTASVRRVRYLSLFD